MVSGLYQDAFKPFSMKGTKKAVKDLKVGHRGYGYFVSKKARLEE